MAFIGNQPISQAFLTDQFSGNGSTTAFTMSVAPATTSSILVAVTGVVQDPSTYSVVGTTLTFSAAPPSGTGNISVRYLGIPASGVTTTAYRTLTEFTATAGQTTFTPPSYTVGYINVYRNGARLGTADFTASNGTTVVLAQAAAVGDLVTTESFYVSSVLNAIPATAGSVSTSYLVDGSVTQTKLGTNVAGNGPAFSAYSNTTQSLSGFVYTKVALQAEEYDTNNNFDSTTNYRFTPTVAGYYQVNAAVYLVGGASAQLSANIYKNGANYKQGPFTPPATNDMGSNISVLVYMNGSTDYIELYAYQTGGSARNLYGVAGSSSTTWFQASLARSS